MADAIGTFIACPRAPHPETSTRTKQSYLADFLTTHLRRGTITAIEQLGWDRILKITVQPVSDEPIQPSPKAVMAEFMGKHSNIILIDATDDRILESLKRIDETMSRHREILPGETYTLPPQQEKLDPLTLDKATFTEFVGGQEEVRWRQLFNKIDGLSPMLAKEIVARVTRNRTLGSLSTGDRLFRCDACFTATPHGWR